MFLRFLTVFLCCFSGRFANGICKNIFISLKSPMLFSIRLHTVREFRFIFYVNRFMFIIISDRVEPKTEIDFM